VDGFIRKMIFKATRRKWEKFCFAGRDEMTLSETASRVFKRLESGSSPN